jgi:hypothetical protein
LVQRGAITSLHFIQSWWHVITSLTFFDSSILETMTALWNMTTQTMTGFGKYKNFWHTEKQVLWNILSDRTFCCVWIDCVVQRKVVFQHYIPKRHKRFGIKIYKLCKSLGYTYDKDVYLGTQRQLATAQITATCEMVLQVIQRVEGLGHRIFVDNYFTSPVLFDDLCQWKINICGTVRHDRCGMPQDIGPKSLKIKRGNILTQARGNLRSVRWKDGWDLYILTNVHTAPVEGSFTDASGHAIKPQ